MEQNNIMFHQGYINAFINEFEDLKKDKAYQSSLHQNKEQKVFKQRKGFYKLSNTLLYANLSKNALFVYIHLRKFTEKVNVSDAYLRAYLKSKSNQKLSALALKKAKEELIAKNLLQIIKTNYHRINYEWIVKDENNQIIRHFNKDKIQNYLLVKNEAKKQEKNKTTNPPQNEVQKQNSNIFSAHAKTQAEKQNRYYIETHAPAFPFEKNLNKFKNIIKFYKERKDKERGQKICFFCQSQTQEQTRLHTLKSSTKQRNKHKEHSSNQNLFISTIQNLNQKDIKQMNEQEKITPPTNEIFILWLKEFNTLHNVRLDEFEISSFRSYYYARDYRFKSGEYITNFKECFFSWCNNTLKYNYKRNNHSNTQRTFTQQSYHNTRTANPYQSPKNEPNTQILPKEQENTFFAEPEIIPTKYGNPRDFMTNPKLSGAEKMALLNEWKAKNPNHTEEGRKKAFEKTLFEIYQSKLAQGENLL